MLMTPRTTLDNAEVEVVLRRVEKCVADRRNWLEANMLKVNDEKTEVILFIPKHRVLKHVSVKVGAFDIRSVPIVRNLHVGALFDYDYGQAGTRGLYFSILSSPKHQ